jgi:hypothetical protein
MKTKKIVKGNQNIKKERDIFTVEKVLGKKVKKRKTFYLVKWFNYTDNYNTWEPEENLQIDPSLIEDFEEERKENRRRSK